MESQSGPEAVPELVDDSPPVLNLTLIGQEAVAEQAERLGTVRDMTITAIEHSERTVSDTISFSDASGLLMDGTVPSESGARRVVEQQHWAGGTSVHRRSESGEQSLTVGEGYPAGVRNEGDTAVHFAAYLVASGMDVHIEHRSEMDKYREDRLLVLANAPSIPLQVCSGIIDRRFNEERRRSASLHGDDTQMASWVHEAILFKVEKYRDEDEQEEGARAEERKLRCDELILLLDYAMAPLATSPSVAERYRASYPDAPEKAFRAVYLVGPGAQFVTQLSEDSGLRR